ncbi:DHS-like NAD/FAD-binding domain-containing protein [Multifurca ochricompacta]|uniref:DHS-like NAD/FAD-binding domain-containing protein n=1 Tax=Multifurca ochricompacta TaxID=376703 RepID=A0AAD4LXU5_9AGAM|nr:DHS-like NAD/FAD-binding domain-containing protein [Multifurca ochricompacta]
MYPSTLSSKQRRTIYEGQVRAFLDASEIVEMDEDTLDDILDSFGGFDEEVCDDDEVTGEQDLIPVRKLDRDAAGNIQLHLPYGFYVFFGPQGLSSFLKEYVITRAIPIRELLCAFDIHLCEELQKKKPRTLVYFLQVVLSGELQLRERLSQYSTVQDAVNLIASSRRIIILTGAGISVSCGIPDFRSRNGLYASLKEKGEYDLDDPSKCWFDIQYFKENPSGDSFARQIYPSNFTPSPCHRFIKLIENNGQNYTQNIDTLETVVGVRNVLQCHGSFATASCLDCRIRVPGNVIEQEIMQGEVPLCKTCSDSESRRRKRGKPLDNEDEEDEPLFPPWIMKPDITFFGEKLTDNFEDSLEKDRAQADLLLIIGTSLKVAPVSDIISRSYLRVRQKILINKTPVAHINPDIILLGDADRIIEHLCTELGWTLPPAKAGQYLSGQIPTLVKRQSQELAGPAPKRVEDSHVWLFEGAEGGKWLSDLEATKARDAETSEPPLNTTSPPPTPVTPADAPRDAKRARVL